MPKIFPLHTPMIYLRSPSSSPGSSRGRLPGRQARVWRNEGQPRYLCLETGVYLKLRPVIEENDDEPSVLGNKQMWFSERNQRMETANKRNNGNLYTGYSQEILKVVKAGMESESEGKNETNNVLDVSNRK